MSRKDVYKKYQVYFFLYLAVICELLIVIVERDEAEEGLLIKQKELEKKNRQIILELLKNMPAVAAAGDNQLKVNESRSFTILVKGLGEKDQVTTPPTVKVTKDGSEIQLIQYTNDPTAPDPAIKDSTLQSTTGERLYRFTWKADHGPGLFEFQVKAGTNRVGIMPEMATKSDVKVGTLNFTRKEIQNAIDYDQNLRGTPIEVFIRKSEDLDPARFTVEVISEAYDQLQILAENIVTAVGYETYDEIKVRGTTTDKVSAVDASGGGTTLDPRNPRNPYKTDDPTRGKWVWTGRFNEAGTKTITVSARDNRGAGALSVAKPISFNVNVRQPFIRGKQPSKVRAYAGELFMMNINVHGLESSNEYSWTITADGQQVLDSAGPVVRYYIPEAWAGKSITIRSSYNGRSYSWQDSSATSGELKPSEFTFKVNTPTDRIYPNFEADVVYPQNFEFTFDAFRCGICTKVNEKAIPINEIDVEAMKASGGVLTVEKIAQTDIVEGKEKSTKVRFRIKGRISKTGEAVRIKMTAAQATEEIDVKLKGS